MATRLYTPRPRAGERALVLEAHPSEGLDLTAVSIALCGVSCWLLPAVGYIAGWL